MNSFEDQIMAEEVKPAIESPFYLMRPPPGKQQLNIKIILKFFFHNISIFLLKDEEKLNGSTNLILHADRQQAFKQYCCKKVKEPLSAFLPDFPGSIDNIDDEVKAAR